MTLNRKTILLLVLASVGSLLLSYIVLRVTVYETFLDLETSQATSNHRRVDNAIRSELESMVVLNSEYSEWDETYAFLQNPDSEYLSVNINVDTLNLLDVDFVSLLDVDGNMVSGIERGPGETALQLANHPFADRQVIRDRISVSDAPTSRLVGIVEHDQGPMLLVSRPVLRTNGEGLPRGSFVIGRVLDEQRVERLRNKYSVDFNLPAVHSSRLSPELQSTILALESDPVDLPVLHESNRIRTYESLRNILGEPVFAVEVTTARLVSEAGIQALAVALAFLAAASLLYLLISAQSLKRLIITPLMKLTDHIGQLQESGDLSQRISSTRSDEIGILARQFDSLVEALDVAQTDMVTARDNALKASTAKSQFLANMSHEIRTPINGVLGMAELLSSTELSDQQHRYAKMIQRSGDSLLSIIDDILDFSKIEAGKLELDMAPFDLRTVVEESLELLAEPAHNKGLEIVGDIAPETHTDVRGDSARLRQILVNLISNAVKFTNQGQIVARVHEQGCDSDLLYRFEVQDTGIGIDADKSREIFQSFAQGDSSTTRRFGGTGLGLSISRQLVELMGGEIGVDSVEGSGSTFWFTVRFARDEATAGHPFSNMLAGKRALIVDDNATTRGVLGRQLGGWHMQVTKSSSGGEAMRCLSESLDKDDPFDVVLLDTDMPEMDGLELARIIRRDPKFCQLSLVMLGLVSMSDSDANRVQPTLDEWLTKPIRQARLHETLRSVLAGERTERTSTRIRDPERCIEAGMDDHLTEPVTTDNFRDDAEAEHSLSGHVLIADDNLINREVARAMLSSLGYRTTVTGDGDEALQAMATGSFDLILMDCHMPGKDGYETTEEIRRQESETSCTNPVPIIAVTADNLESNRQRCHDCGMDDYVTKPFTQQRLREVLTRWIGASRRENASGTDRLANFPDADGRPLAIEPIDPEVLDEIRGLDPGKGDEMLREIAFAYCSTSAILMLRLRSAIADRDAESIEQIAHALKGASAQIGAKPLASICGDLVADARIEEFHNARALMERAAIEHCAVIQALDKEVQTSAA